jgi:hypothetical protein
VEGKFGRCLYEMGPLYLGIIVQDHRGVRAETEVLPGCTHIAPDPDKEAAEALRSIMVPIAEAAK